MLSFTLKGFYIMRSIIFLLAFLIIGISPALAQIAEKEGRRVYNTRIATNSPVFVTTDSGLTVARNSGSSPVFLSAGITRGSGGAPISLNQIVKGVSNAADGTRDFSALTNFSPFGTTDRNRQYALGVNPDEVRRRQEARRLEAEQRKKITDAQMRMYGSTDSTSRETADRFRSTFRGTDSTSNRLEVSNRERASTIVNKPAPRIFVTDRGQIQTPSRTFGER
jgi:hypothetical protein